MQAWSTGGNALDMTYGFNLSAGDNGNVVSVTNNLDATRSQTFAYDPLNRLSVAQTTSTYSTSPAHCWGESFGYDAWGNLLSIGVASTSYNGCAQESLSVTATAQNRISGNSYDTAGNMTALPGGGSATYNAENQLTSTAGVTYTYDGDGKRVQKSNGTLYWYGMTSDVLDETDLSGNLTNEYIFFGGKRIARRDSSNNVSYYFADHLGTSRIVTNAAGTILDDSDFYPFGGERVIVSSSGNHYKFTGKERDSESGLDDFGARYYASTMGRFMTTDPVVVTPDRLRDPQQLNQYAYVRNNPLRLVDPTGEILQLSGNTAADYNNLCEIAGDACDRITVNKDGTVSFNTEGLDLSKNEGAALINNLVESKSTFDFSVGPTVETAGGTVQVDFIKNLPPSADQLQYRKCQCPADTETPRKGVDDQVAFNPNDTRGVRESLTNLKLAEPFTVVFHELAEAYAKVDGGQKTYADAHGAAMKREDVLRDQRPYLKEHNPGSGGPVGKPDTQVIIKSK
jgi:RHS repeat-associated protein